MPRAHANTRAHMYSNTCAHTHTHTHTCTHAALQSPRTVVAPLHFPRGALGLGPPRCALPYGQRSLQRAAHYVVLSWAAQRCMSYGWQTNCAWPGLLLHAAMGDAYSGKGQYMPYRQHSLAEGSTGSAHTHTAPVPTGAAFARARSHPEWAQTALTSSTQREQRKGLHTHTHSVGVHRLHKCWRTQAAQMRTRAGLHTHSRARARSYVHAQPPITCAVTPMQFPPPHTLCVPSSCCPSPSAPRPLVLACPDPSLALALPTSHTISLPLPTLSRPRPATAASFSCAGHKNSLAGQPPAAAGPPLSCCCCCCRNRCCCCCCCCCRSSGLSGPSQPQPCEESPAGPSPSPSTSIAQPVLRPPSPPRTPLLHACTSAPSLQPAVGNEATGARTLSEGSTQGSTAGPRPRYATYSCSSSCSNGLRADAHCVHGARLRGIASCESGGGLP